MGEAQTAALVEKIMHSPDWKRTAMEMPSTSAVDLTEATPSLPKVAGFGCSLRVVHVPEEIRQMSGVDGRPPISTGSRLRTLVGLGGEGAVFDDRADVEHAHVDTFVRHFGVRVTSGSS